MGLLRRPAGVAGSLLTLGLVVAGCSPQTAGAPSNGLIVTAEFETIRNLVPGHAVRVADVQVGSVSAVELNDEYRAVVTMIVEHDVRIPVGTTAVIQKTSLLGENYIGLHFPSEFDAENGPFLATGDSIGQTDVLPDIEQVAGRAAEFVGALAVDDLSTIFDAASEGLVGNGELLNQLIGDLAAVASAYADNAPSVASAIDDFGQLGGQLAAGTDDLLGMLDSVEGFTAATARQRTKLVGLLNDLSRLARTIDRTLIGASSTALEDALESLAPIVRTLVDERATLESLLDGLEDFVVKIQLAVTDELTGVFGFLNPAGPPPPSASAALSQQEQLIRLLEPAP